MTALLDVNVLVALFNPGHVHHTAAHQWFSALSKDKWAACPITINGCIRILCRPGVSAQPLTVSDVASWLRSLAETGNLEFWTENVSLLDDEIFNLDLVMGPRQLTDVYLLGLAIKHGGQLVTFDRSIPWRAVRGAKASHLKILVS